MLLCSWRNTSCLCLLVRLIIGCNPSLRPQIQTAFNIKTSLDTVQHNNRWQSLANHLSLTASSLSVFESIQWDTISLQWSVDPQPFLFLFFFIKDWAFKGCPFHTQLCSYHLFSCGIFQTHSFSYFQPWTSSAENLFLPLNFREHRWQKIHGID